MDVVGVVTSLIRGVAQVLHGDPVVELSVQLEVQEVEGKEEDKEGQVEEEKVELKEKRTCTWMTSDETQNLSQEVQVRQDEQSVTKIARSQCMLR